MVKSCEEVIVRNMAKRVFLPTFNIHFGIWPEILFSETNFFFLIDKEKKND